MELWVDYFGWLVFQVNDDISLAFILIDLAGILGHSQKSFLSLSINTENFLLQS